MSRAETKGREGNREGEAWNGGHDGEKGRKRRVPQYELAEQGSLAYYIQVHY